MGRNKAKNMPLLPHKDPTYWQVLTCQYVAMSKDTFFYFLDKFSKPQCWRQILGAKFQNQLFGHTFLSQNNVKHAKAPHSLEPLESF